MSENAINPDHYKDPSGVECRDIAQHLGFNLGNAVKYIWRHDQKGKPIEDLKKALKYLEWEKSMMIEKQYVEVSIAVKNFKKWQDYIGHTFSDVMRFKIYAIQSIVWACLTMDVSNLTSAEMAISELIEIHEAYQKR